ncbi:hypothetical protein HG536_0G03560 [Torulaspora globosa]|uniref:Uncharacterized protein n=1 Tax=Torulaspora globosa TaxID=48254 RepID=A0A7G3ZLV8_9SACH|nr:uncharacterized protein HG536_0G03560 [Torulaspora globosa]QLL34494.1 hypothetical protein HG536_0G03560 [Torulaspora globosa]
MSDIDSLASVSGGNEEHILEEDYLNDERRATIGHWGRLKYWITRNLLSRDRSNESWQGHGIPLYELNAEGQEMSGTIEPAATFVYRHSNKIPWRLIARFIGLSFFFVITAFLIFGVIESGPKKGRFSTSALFDPYVRYSNGTLDFFPLTVMVSLDGFHPSLISKKYTPFLYQLYTLAYEGNVTSTPFMIPSFPSQTFPNHWSLVTGEYPRDHSLVSNVFWDADLKEEFYPGLMDPLIWANTSRPIWQVLQAAFNHNSAKEFPFKVATHMWPGSDVNFTGLPQVPAERMPYYIDAFDGDEKLETKLTKVLGYVDIDSIEKRPQLILSYVPQVDAFGHKHGYPINDPENKMFDKFTQVLSSVDSFVEGLFEGLRERNVTNFTNVVIVSDHGMSNIKFPEHVLIWEELLDKDLIKNHVEHAYGEGPMMAVTTKDSSDVNEIYQELKKSLANQGELGSKFKVYLNGNFPEHFKFNDLANRRIAPIWIIPEPGYAVMSHKFAKKQRSSLIGNHGYDNHEAEMRSLFIGVGPFFENGYVEPFENIEIFDMLCDVFGVAMDDRLGDQQDTFFYRKPLEQPLVDDFESLRAKYGNGTAYNIIWGGEQEEEEVVADTSGTSTTSSSSGTSTTSSSSGTSTTSSTSTTRTTSTTSTTTSTTAAGGWLDDLLHDAEELIEELVDEIQEIADTHH